MNVDSWASYRAAAPPEVFGEPDDDIPTGKPSPDPAAFVVEWYPEELIGGEWMRVRCFRFFSGDTHGNFKLAGVAAHRWAVAMRRKHGKHHVLERFEG